MVADDQYVDITEDGEQLTVQADEAKHLERSGLAYWCPECEQYHLGVDKTWDEIDFELNSLKGKA